jgi:hypothetical protein
MSLAHGRAGLALAWSIFFALRITYLIRVSFILVSANTGGAKNNGIKWE